MTVREVIDRSIYEHLRLALVSASLLVDKTLYNNIAAYETALNNLTDVCKLFGVGRYDTRVGVNSNRIIIDSKSKGKGTVGATAVYTYEEQENGKFTKLRYPEHTTDLTYEITVVTSDTTMHRSVLDLVYSILGDERYLNTLASNLTLTGEPILISNIGDVEIATGDFMETKLTYLVKDVWLIPFKVLATDIPKLVNVDTEYFANLPS